MNYMLNRFYLWEVYIVNGVWKYVIKDGGIGVICGKVGVEIWVLLMGDLIDILISNIFII